MTCGVILSIPTSLESFCHYCYFQIANQALKGEMNNVVRQQVVSAMNNQNVNARTLLKDSDNMDKFIGMVHDIIKHGDDAKLSALLGKMGL